MKVPWLLDISLLHIKHGCLVASIWEIVFLRQQLVFWQTPKMMLLVIVELLRLDVSCGSLPFLEVFAFLEA